MNQFVALMREKWLMTRDRFTTLNLPPFIKLGLLVAVGVLPFAAFVALQNNDSTEPDAAPIQQAIDTSQKVPLLFPFGGNPEPVTPLEPEVVEMSPSPDPTPTKSPAAPQCANGKDDDKDGKIDLKDPGCSSRTDKTESPDPQATKPPVSPAAPPAAPTPPQPAPSTPPAPTPTPPASPPAPSPTPSRVPLGECDDGIDNDNDGKIDLEDKASCHGDPTEDE